MTYGRYTLDSAGRGTGTNTPWGRSQHSRVIARGILEVSTAGHGGIGITVNAARRVGLSDAARDRGELSGTRFWYEEDCAWAILAWDLGPTYWPMLFERNKYEPGEDGGTICVYQGRDAEGGEVFGRESIRTHLLRTLSTWNADYLLAIGETPDPQGLAHYLAAQERDRRRKANDPDLIVSASGMGDGTTVVTTADGLQHRVTAQSYRDLGRDDAGLLLLSRCEPSDVPLPSVPALV